MPNLKAGAQEKAARRAALCYARRLSVVRLFAWTLVQAPDGYLRVLCFASQAARSSFVCFTAS